MPCAGVRGGDPVGGQAVMEGVMMRAPHSYCVAVRKPSGEIVTEEKDAAAAI
jgi:Predicted metal-dependent enzyme